MIDNEGMNQLKSMVLNLDVLEYRWSNKFLHNPALSTNMITRFSKFEYSLKKNHYPNPMPLNGDRQWATIQEMKKDIEINGMRNPIICWQIPNSEKILTLVGNQRLCITRALGWNTIRAWMVNEWHEQNKLMKLYR